jgi:hypothetical protein
LESCCDTPELLILPNLVLLSPGGTTAFSLPYPQGAARSIVVNKKKDGQRGFA